MTANRTDNIPYAAPVPDDIDAILRKHLNVTGDNIRLREELATARKARDAAQELLEAERQKCAKIEADGAQQAFSMGEAMGAAIWQKATLQSSLADARGECHRLKHDLDTEKLLRVNHLAAIEGLQLRLREAEGQLRAQRLSAAEVSEIRAYVPYGDRVARAENVELRRTISLMAKTAAEVQDNFRLIAELAADPADEAHKEPKP
jgi:hypothetical protein